MPSKKQTHHAFILRLWYENDENCRTWRGWIQHVGSGEEVFVQNLTNFLAFIEQHFGALADANRSENEEKTSRKRLF